MEVRCRFELRGACGLSMFVDTYRGGTHPFDAGLSGVEVLWHSRAMIRPTHASVRPIPKVH
jgi:hypothetical protein